MLTLFQDNGVWATQNSPSNGLQIQPQLSITEIQTFTNNYNSNANNSAITYTYSGAGVDYYAFTGIMSGQTWTNAETTTNIQNNIVIDGNTNASAFSVEGITQGTSQNGIHDVSGVIQNEATFTQANPVYTTTANSTTTVYTETIAANFETFTPVGASNPQTQYDWVGTPGIGSWLVYGEGTTIPVENQVNGAATESLANLGTSINGNVVEYTSATVVPLPSSCIVFVSALFGFSIVGRNKPTGDNVFFRNKKHTLSVTVV